MALFTGLGAVSSVGMSSTCARLSDDLRPVFKQTSTETCSPPLESFYSLVEAAQGRLVLFRHLVNLSRRVLQSVEAEDPVTLPNSLEGGCLPLKSLQTEIRHVCVALPLRANHGFMAWNSLQLPHPTVRFRPNSVI